MRATKFHRAPKMPMKGISAKLRDLKPGQTILIEGGSPTSVRSLLTRVRIEFEKEDRQFTSRQTNDGVRVWRLA